MTEKIKALGHLFKKKREPAVEFDAGTEPTVPPTNMVKLEKKFHKKELKKIRKKNPNFQLQDPETQTGYTDISDQPWHPGRGNDDPWKRTGYQNPLRSHPVTDLPGAPHRPEGNKAEYLNPDPARKLKQEWYPRHIAKQTKLEEERLKQEELTAEEKKKQEQEEREKLMAETIDKIKNDERINAEDLYDLEDEASWTTREKRKSHGLTPSKTEPAIPTHTPSPEKQPPQPTPIQSAAPANNIISQRPRSGSVDEVMLPHVTGTTKGRNRNAACMPSGMTAHAGLTEMGSDGKMRQTLDFEYKEDKDVYHDRASPQSQAGPSGTYQAGPSGGYGMHLSAPGQSNRYSQAPGDLLGTYWSRVQTPAQILGSSQAQAGPFGTHGTRLENLSPRQTYGSSEAEAYPTGTYGTPVPPPRQTIARKPVAYGQVQARPSGTYQDSLFTDRGNNGDGYVDDSFASILDNNDRSMNDAFIEDDTDLELPSSPPTVIRREVSEHSSPQLPRLPRPLTVADYRSSASFSAAAVQTPTRPRGQGENDLLTRVDEVYHSARGDGRN